MKKKVQSEKQLVAEFFSNIGVAWFVAGVIGVFVGKSKNIVDIFISFSWGLLLSLIFLSIGIMFIRGKK